MCGIAGFVDFKHESSEGILADMTCSLPHRGPDGQGVFFCQHEQANIGLGHRRLSIIDLSSSANQPMHLNGLHVIFNGEIYNYAEIRAQLIKEGHEFATHSDTEVILHSWQEWGPEAIRYWHGMFAIVLFDEKKNEVTFIRDRAGAKPLYYYYKDDLFLFGSELKPILKHPSFEKVLNKNAVASFLQYGYVSHPHCIYQNTYKVPPGYYLTLSLHDRKTALTQYWNVYDYYNKPKLKISLEEAISHTEEILKKAFQYRMVADVPVGVFLSGGYDSSCVTALLQSSCSEKLKTFTIGTGEQKINEAPYAKEIANILGTDHTEYYCTAKEVLDIVPQLGYYYDEPFADSSAIPTILVSKLAREKVTVALSADAGDEIFAGYNRYDFMAKFGARIKSIPAPMRKLAAAAMDRIPAQKLPYFKDMRNFNSRYDKLKNLLINPSNFEVINSLSQTFNDSEIEEICKHRIMSLQTLHNSRELMAEYYDPLSFMMAIDYQTYMVDDILQKVDRATMSVSLEGREPFLDQSIIEWAAQLPSDYKYHNKQKKFIVKEIVHKYIPKSKMDRPKMGFAIPIESWLKRELKPLVLEHLSNDQLKLHGLFNQDKVQALVHDFYNGRSEKYLKIWNLLMFQIWYKQWFS